MIFVEHLDRIKERSSLECKNKRSKNLEFTRKIKVVGYPLLKNYTIRSKKKNHQNTRLEIAVTAKNIVSFIIPANIY